MRGINKAIIIGHLGADPETRYTTSGGAITNIRVATSEKWKDKQGQPQERTEWHRVVMFGKVAEVAAEFLSKGSLVFIEGQIRTRKWTDKQGQDRYSTEIVVEGYHGTMQMIGGRSEQQASPQQQGFRDPPSKPKPAEPPPEDFDSDDDIPF